MEHVILLRILVGLLSIFGSSLSETQIQDPFRNSSEVDWARNGIPYNPQHARQRNSKFFPLFTIIRFTNEPCQTTNEENGICYTRSQCNSLGGLSSGNCAQGLGVCCQFHVTCGAVVNQNGTVFRNPDFPNKYRPKSGSDVCQVRVRKQLNICQLRLNFLKFDVDGPMGLGASTGTGATTTTDAGTCKTDSLSITSSGAVVPPLCGNLNGQHLYLDYGTSDTVTLNLLLSQNTDREREWNIEIAMIPCRSELRAPTGCLQYFQGVSGQVESFNNQGGTHLANMDYSVCVRMEDGMRSIEWSGCKAGDVKISGPTPVPTTPASPVVCPTANQNDYLTIMGGVSYPLPTTAPATGAVPIGQSSTDRFCDAHFGYSNSLVRSNARPFLLHFKTDGTEIAASGTDASTGFCLKWQQSPSTI